MSTPSSQINATLFSEEPRSTTNPPSLEALAAPDAPLERFMMESATSTLVVSIVVVVPLTVRFPLIAKLEPVIAPAARLPEKLALLPSDAIEPV